MNLIQNRTYTPAETRRRKIIYFWLHISVLLLSLFLITVISIDTFNNVPFYQEPSFKRVQFWICILFLFDFFFEWTMAEKKWHYLLTHFLFFLVAIPYNAIFEYFGITFSEKVEYLVRYIPLVRGGYALAIVVSWLTANRATSLFISYLLTIVATVYFASVIFFVFEEDINPLVNNYLDALWWASMDVTTVGSNIIAVTAVGRVLSVVLAALGMMLFPIFTVYITSVITRRNKQGLQIGQGNFAEEEKKEADNVHQDSDSDPQEKDNKEAVPK